MKLYFHIGAEKTGTTSAQNWFCDNRDALRASGVVYCKSLGERNNRGMSLLCLENDSAYSAVGALTAHARAGHRALLEDALRAEVAQAEAQGAHSFIISNEHCQSRLLTPEQMERATEILRPLFSEVEVLCFLRPQVDVAISLASTLSRWVEEPVGQAFLDAVTPANPYYNYALLAQRWAGAFGAESLALLSFRRWPTCAHYLIQRLRLEPARFTAIPRVNEALDFRTIAMTNQIGLPYFRPDGSVNPFANMFLEKIACTETLALGLDRARQIQARFAHSNRELLREFPEFPAEDLEPDWEAHDRPSNFEQLGQPCVFADQARQMLLVFNQHLLFQRALTALARARLAFQRRNRGNAQSELARCEALLKSFDGVECSVDGLPALRKQVEQFAARLAAMP